MKRIIVASLLGFAAGVVVTKLLWPSFQFPADEKTLEQVRDFVREFSKHTNVSGGCHVTPVPQVPEGQSSVPSNGD